MRSYAHVKGEFTPQAWYGALENGNTFVTNGPMLTFQINGQGMGSALSAARGDVLNVEATARINPDIDELDRLELVAHGDVVASVSMSDSEGTLTLRHQLTASAGAWLAVRAYGKAQAIAHSSPVYVEVDGPGSWSGERAPALIEAMRARLSRLVETPIVLVHELEFWEMGDDLESLWERQRPLIRQRVVEANRHYDDLLRAIEARR